MTISGFSIFGFDLFGLTRRPPPQEEDTIGETEAARFRADDDERDDLETQPETFFWGMYPVY